MQCVLVVGRSGPWRCDFEWEKLKTQSDIYSRIWLVPEQYEVLLLPCRRGEVK
jgi:hypothetical protein